MKTINPIKYPGWDELLFSDPSYSFFHSSAWAKVIYDTYKYKSLYHTTIKNNKIESLIPIMEVDSLYTGKRGVSLPFSDYCEPIFQNQNNIYDYMEYLINYGKSRNWSYIELRGGKVPSEIHPFKSYYIHNLKLSLDHNVIFRNFRSNNRRNIKKAIKNSVKTQISHAFESVEIFYKLHCITRKRHGLPPQPFRFFANIFNNIISKGHGTIMTAHYKGKAISAAVYFHFGKKVIYKFGASDFRYQHLRANNLVMWEAIKWYCRNGYQKFCFGRTSPENKGLIQFKSGWNTKAKTLKYYKYHLRKNNFISINTNSTQVTNKVFSKMPIFFLRFIGTILYPHIG